MSHVDRHTEDVKIEAMEEASVALVIGYLFIVVAAIAGIYTFQTFRDGTWLWRGYEITLGVIGVVLVGIGNRGRNINS